jgi:NAD+ synthase (glutamine-hydrolysing)
MSSQGKVVYRLPAFREAVVAVPVSQALVNEASVYLPVVPEQERLFAALVLGVRDYVQKTGFQRVLIGLSGGIDSALTAVIATKALGPQHVTGVYLPSVYSSPRSGQDAAELAHNLGIRLHTMAIDPVVDAARAGLEGLLGTEGQVTGPLVRENLQSRSRCLLLMALANQWGALVLNTGNKSELMTGYCTQYGDLCGALGVLADLLKTEVYALAHWVNDQKPVIPAYTLSREPSAELSPNQKDQDFLPPYPVLDKMVHLCLEAHCTPENMVRYGLAPEWVQRFFELYTRSEYKRSQMPLGLKVSPLALGCGRRVPVACKWG